MKIKDSHIFPTKKQGICKINVRNFNVTLTYDVINFEQLSPEINYVGPTQAS